MKTQREDGMLGFRPFDTTRATRCQFYMPAPLHPQIPWYSFLLEAEWTPWLINAEKENRSLENFQGTYWDSQNLPSCGAVPQPTGTLLALSSLRKSNLFISKRFVTVLQH